METIEGLCCFWVQQACGGANVLAVQRQLGHKDASVTLNTYASLWDQDLDAVGAMMEQRFSNVVGLSWAAVS